MEEQIIAEILSDNSVVMVGVSQSGKTYWVQNILIPKLLELGKTVSYFKDGSDDLLTSDIAIFDEVETLFDFNQLQEKYPDEKPYYSDSYLEKVKKWHDSYKKHTEPSVYIISRRETDIQYLVENFKKTDWDGRIVKVFKFDIKR